VAAAIAPLIAPLLVTELPKLVDLIVGLVHQKAPAAEAALGSGTGPVKFADVFAGVMNDLARAHAAGQLETIPDDTTAKLIIQSIVTSMKVSGWLTGSPSPLVPGVAAPLVLTAGQSLTISVK